MACCAASTTVSTCTLNNRLQKWRPLSGEWCMRRQRRQGSSRDQVPADALNCCTCEDGHPAWHDLPSCILIPQVAHLLCLNEQTPRVQPSMSACSDGLPAEPPNPKGRPASRWAWRCGCCTTTSLPAQMLHPQLQSAADKLSGSLRRMLCSRNTNKAGRSAANHTEGLREPPAGSITLLPPLRLPVASSSAVCTIVCASQPDLTYSPQATGWHPGKWVPLCV